MLLDCAVEPLHPRLIAVVGIAPWLLFVAWPLAVAALVGRRWWLGAAAVVLVALQVLLLLPTFAPWHTPPRAVTGSTFTVFDQNVRFDNVDLTRVGRQIAANHPQLVTLEELSTGNVRSLEATGAVAGYPYSYVHLDGGSRGYGVWSTMPLRGAGLWRTGGLLQVQATLTLPGGGTATLLVVHTDSPTTGGDAGEWDRECTDIAARIRATRGPLLLLGDLNATQPMRQLRRILAAGVRDGAATTGDGWRMTWPNGRRVLPRFFRLDHALVSPALTVTAYRVGRADGSDHSPLELTVGRTA